MEKKCDEELIHSRRSRRREHGSGGSTPRMSTPVRKTDSVSYTSPCVMNLSVTCGNIPQNDDLLEKQIEEKEKILAKLLNLESLSIKSPIEKQPAKDLPDRIYNTEKFAPKEIITQVEKPVEVKPIKEKPKDTPKPVENKSEKPVQKKIETIDLVPKVVKLPNNWNLENIEIKLDLKNGVKDASSLISPDDLTESEWEII